MKKLQKRCYSITTSKGFDLSLIGLQLLLIASEVQECLENIELNISNRAKPFFNRFKKNMDEFETIRKKVSLCDSSTIKKNNNLAEELADVVIRVLSFAEFLEIDLLSVINKKLKVNEKRPFLHGKKF